MAGKTVIQTQYALDFATTMDAESIVRYNAILDVLEERGRPPSCAPAKKSMEKPDYLQSEL